MDGGEVKEQPVWGHRCLRLPGHEGTPTKIYMQGCGCCYCGQPDPEEQAKIDTQAASLLRDDAHARREMDAQLQGEIPDMEWIEPRPDMGEPGGYQEVQTVDDTEIPF
jgi:hypothetical protein